MPTAPAIASLPPEMFRVERRGSDLRLSRVTAEKAPNRFDVPNAGILYTATTAQGALAETTAQFRPSATLAQRMVKAGGTPDEVKPQPLDASWRTTRTIRRLRIQESLPFIDIEAPATHTFLTAHASSVLVEEGVTALDVAMVRGPNRRLTRGLATWLYRATDEDGEPLYGGIRYLSRLNTDYECWAVFDRTPVELVDERLITIDDPDLVKVAALHGLLLA